VVPLFINWRQFPKMNNFHIEINRVDFSFSYSDPCYFVLAKDSRDGNFTLLPLPLSYTGLRLPGYETGIEMLPGWESRTFRDNWSLRNLFGSGVIATPDSMETWLEKPSNQQAFQEAIRGYYTTPGRRVLSYNGRNSWSLVPYQ
jgi:hypothetical protein